MKYGVNLLLIGEKVDSSLLRWLPRLADMGFDGVEIPIFNPGAVDVDAVRAAAERNALEITNSGALPPGSRLYGDAAAPRRAAERYLADCLSVTAALGSRLLCGPLYKVVGDTDLSVPLPRQRREAAESLRPIVHQARELGVTVALEPLNRFETNLLNTAAQGVAFCRALRDDHAGLLLDTFHMHIEEADSPAAVSAAAAAGRIRHFHAAENDRGVAGSGQVHWKPVAAALARAGYDGWVVLESFSQTSETIKAAVSCWRPFYPSAQEFCRRGLAFVTRTFRRPRRPARKAGGNRE